VRPRSERDAPARAPAAVGALDDHLQRADVSLERQERLDIADDDRALTPV
jgi:hypothetical protein